LAARSFGLTVAPEFRDSPLVKLSARALQLYVHLAAYAAQQPRQQDISGVVIAVGLHELVASWRVMKGWIGCGQTAIGETLSELVTASAISVEPIYQPAKHRPRTVPNQDRQRSQTRTVQRSGNGTGRRFVISRIKVHGINTLQRNADGPNLGPRSNSKDRRSRASLQSEWDVIDRQLEAEA
jgi:hypothetical protein